MIMVISYEITLGILKPTVCSSHSCVQEVIRSLKGTNLAIARSRKLFWKRSEAERFYGEHKGRFYFPRLVEHAMSGPSLALALHGPDAIARWRTLIGPTHAYRAAWTQPETLRGQYGVSDTRNGFHGSSSMTEAFKELSQVFPGWDVEWWLKHSSERME